MPEMITSLEPDKATHPVDYWILRFWRDLSVLLVFFVALILQVGISRILVFSMLTGLVAILIGHVMTVGRYSPGHQLLSGMRPSNWPSTTKLLVGCFYSFIAWMAISLFWSPTPQQGLRNILILLPLLPLTYFVALEQSKVIFAPFSLILRFGLFAAIILLLLEMNRITAFHKLDGPRTELYDLNRNAALIAMLCWIPTLYLRERKIDKFIYVLGIILAGTAVFFSESESAKLCFVVAFITGVLIYFQPYFGRVMYLSLVLFMISFPFILPPLVKILDIEQVSLIKNSHAKHRIAIWLGYQKLILEKPVYGWGVKADRYLGKNGEASKIAKAEGFPDITTNPHNFILEMWVNFGLIGVFLLSFCLLLFERTMRNLKRRQYIVACQLVAGGYAFSSTASSIFQGWWISVLLMVSIAFIVSYRQSMAQTQS